MASIFKRRIRLKEMSLKTRLALAFASVVTLAALLSSLVYLAVLVTTMRQSTREKIEETSKVALTYTENAKRGLEIYADLVSSDMTFGQVLSFDSALAIAQKIQEFSRLSRADLVAFVPRAEQYTQIKNELFMSHDNAEIAEKLRNSRVTRELLDATTSESRTGWISLGPEIYLFAMKPVLHFGANMGAIFLGRRPENSFAQAVASATGTEVVIFDGSNVFGSTLPQSPAGFPRQRELAAKPTQLIENFPLGGSSYYSYFMPISSVDRKWIAMLSLHVSDNSIRQARNRTITRVTFVAVLATLLSAIIGYLLARAISNPLQTMTQGIHSIMQKGDLGIRIQGGAGGEIEILTDSFNQLLGQLQDAHEKLAASERRMKQELTMASTVQEMLFPDRTVRLGRIELSSFISTSTETGGDWFGYGQDKEGRHATILIGDVTGHGMPAALITAITNGFFKGVKEAEDAVAAALAELGAAGEASSLAPTTLLLERFRTRNHLSPADMLVLLNDILLKSTKGSLLMTFFASVFDSQKQELRYANAGHNRPFLLQSTRNEGRATVLASEPSHRLGEKSDVKFYEQSIALQPGDIITWYTDGLLECENARGEMFGKRRLMNVLRAHGSRDAEAIRDAIVSEALRFFDNHPLKDDITVVVGKVI